MVKQISGKQNKIQQEIPVQENPFAKPSHLLDAENLQIKIPLGMPGWFLTLELRQFPWNELRHSTSLRPLPKGMA